MDLRPYDTAHRSLVFNEDTHETYYILFTCKQLTFHGDSSLTVRFWSIRNDTSYSGMEVNIPQGDVVRLDLVQSLKEYVSKTAEASSSLFSVINAYPCISVLNATALDCLATSNMLQPIITNHIVSLSYHRAVLWKHKIHKPAWASNQHVTNSCNYTGAALWVASSSAH